MDVVDTRADVAGVGRVDEDAEELGVRLAVLDRENIGVKSSDGVEEVLELGVAEVGVNLGGVLDTSGGELESLDSPVEVGSAFLAGAEGQTLTEGRLIDLDDVDAGLLEVDNLIAESQGELLSLDRLVNVVTGERPPQAGDGASKHTLHGLLGDADSVLALLDGHRSRARDVTDDDRGTHAARTVALDPGVGGEGIAVHTLTEELDHVVTLRLTVNVDVEVKLILDLDVVLNLLLDELVVLSLSDFTLGELVTLDTDVLGLRERADSGGGEERKVELLLLLLNTGRELRLARVVLLDNLGLPVLDLRVVGAARGSASLHGLSVGLKLLADGGRALSDGLGDDGDLDSLLAGEGEPVSDLGVQLLLAGESVRGVEKRAGGSDNDALLAELLDGGLNGLDGALEVGLPDVTAIDNTGRKDGLGAKGTNHGFKLLGVANKVDVKSVDVLGDSLKVVDDVSEVCGEDKLGNLGAKAGKLLVCGLEGSLGLLREVEDEDRLVDLNSLSASFLELGEELLVDGEKLLEEVDGVNRLATVGLAKSQEADGTNENRAGLDASILSLLELTDSLGAVNQGEGLVVLKSGLDVVVVGVEPLDHLETGDVNAILLVATAHGEVLVDGVEAILGVAFGNSLERGSVSMNHSRCESWSAYPEVLDVGKDLVIESKVVAGDDIDTSILLDLPVGKAKALGLGEEVGLRDLAAPV